MAEHAFRPLYQQVADMIRSKIQSGEWGPGTKLPSKRQLAEQAQATLSTIDQAMIVLRTEGWIRGHQGRGVYVADEVPSIE